MQIEATIKRKAATRTHDGVLAADLAGRSSGRVVMPDGALKRGSPLLGDVPGMFVLHNKLLV